MPEKESLELMKVALRNPVDLNQLFQKSKGSAAASVAAGADDSDGAALVRVVEETLQKLQKRFGDRLDDRTLPLALARGAIDQLKRSLSSKARGSASSSGKGDRLQKA